MFRAAVQMGYTELTGPLGMFSSQHLMCSSAWKFSEPHRLGAVRELSLHRHDWLKNWPLMITLNLQTFSLLSDHLLVSLVTRPEAIKDPQLPVVSLSTQKTLITQEIPGVLGAVCLKLGTETKEAGFDHAINQEKAYQISLLERNKFVLFSPHIYTDNSLLLVSIYNRSTLGRQIYSGSSLVIWECRDRRAKGRELRLSLQTTIRLLWRHILCEMERLKTPGIKRGKRATLLLNDICSLNFRMASNTNHLYHLLSKCY